MKFQNPSFNFFFNGRTDKRTNGHTSRKQNATHFFKVGGIKMLFFFQIFKANSLCQMSMDITSSTIVKCT